MSKDRFSHRASQITAILVLIAAIVAGGYGTLAPRWAAPISGYFDVRPGSSLTNNTSSDRPNVESDQTPQGAVLGSLVDEDGQPVRGLEVEMIPVDKSAEGQRSYGKQRAWSDKSGEYEFKNTPPGEYVVGVHIDEAPDGEHPFATAYYPGVDAQADAQKIYVAPDDRVSLQWMRLRTIETLKVAISVRWQDGQTVERGNLLFGNSSYPYSAPVGGYAPEFENGEGSILLPTGFEYLARAKVDCDAGTTIKTIESRPIQRLQLDGNYLAEGLTFIIPSAKCKLWTPPPN
jgi:hypothetical protein